MKRSRLIAVLVLSAALIVAPAIGPAVAVPSASAAGGGVTFTPSPNKWREYMVNILSSVLGKATPNKYKAEQIANQFKYDHSFEALNARFGIDAIRTNAEGQLTGVRWSNPGQGTYEEVVIAGLEEQYKSTSAKGRGPVRAPATPFKTALKVAGAATAVYFAYDLAAGLTASAVNGASSLFGFDANGAVCSIQPELEGVAGDIEKFALRTLSGQDCSQWDFDDEYLRNMDVNPVISYTDACFPDGACVRVLGFVVSGNYATQGALCTKVTGFPPVSNAYQAGTRITLGNGTVVNATSNLPHTASQTNVPNWGDCRPTAGANAYAPLGANTFPMRDTWQKIQFADNRPGSASAGTYATATKTETVEDKERQQKCEVTYTDGSKLSALGLTFKESAGAAPPAVCPNTPAGKTPDRVTVTDTGQPPGAAPLYDEEVTDEYQDWWEQYPECRMGACSLDLIRLTPTPAVSCFDIEDGCVDWHTDPNKQNTYLCRYGAHDVPLAECNVYAGLFQPGRVTVGAPYSDPTTGEWSGGQNAPKGGQTAMARNVQDPTTARSCEFPDFAMDPISWVMRPVQCAFEWAAIPRPLVAEVAFTGVKDVWETKPPGVMAEAAANVGTITGPGGCSVSTTYRGETVPVVNACAGPMALLAQFTRLASVAFIGVLVFGKVRRQIGAMVNYNQGQS